MMRKELPIILLILNRRAHLPYRHPRVPGLGKECRELNNSLSTHLCSPQAQGPCPARGSQAYLDPESALNMLSKRCGRTFTLENHLPILWCWKLLCNIHNVSCLASVAYSSVGGLIPHHTTLPTVGGSAHGQTLPRSELKCDLSSLVVVAPPRAWDPEGHRCPGEAPETKREQTCAASLSPAVLTGRLSRPSPPGLHPLRTLSHTPRTAS